MSDSQSLFLSDVVVLHAPNSPGGAERAHIFEIEDLGHTLKLKDIILSNP